MFTDEQLMAYRSVKAPESLRQNIIGKRKSNKSVISIITAMAACFVLIISGIAINNNQSNIVVNGQKLNSSVEYYCVASAKEKSVSSTVAVPIQFNVNRDTKISVSSGTIRIDGDASSEVVINSPKEITWEVEPQGTQCSFEMLITDKKGVQKVTLEYNNAKVTLTKEKEK